MTNNADSKQTETSNAEPTTFFSRRSLMKGVAGVLGIGALGTAGLWYGTQPSLAATRYEANDNGEITVRTNAGEVMDVMAAPVVAFDWDNFGDGVRDIYVSINASVGSDRYPNAFATNLHRSGGQLQPRTSSSSYMEGTTAEADSPEEYSGSGAVTFPEVSLVGGNISKSSFPTGVAQGESASQSVDLWLQMTAVTELGRSVFAESTAVSFDVIVENPDGTLTATIDSANAAATGADSASENTTSSN